MVRELAWTASCQSIGLAGRELTLVTKSPLVSAPRRCEVSSIPTWYNVPGTYLRDCGGSLIPAGILLDDLRDGVILLFVRFDLLSLGKLFLVTLNSYLPLCDLLLYL